MQPVKQISISLIAIVVLMLCVEFTGLDIWFENFFYNNQTSKWILDTSNPMLHFMLYDGPKKLLVLFELVLLIGATIFHKNPIIKAYQHGILIVLIALPLGPALVSSLKGSTNVACPYALEQYGGDLPYIGLFERYPENQRPEKRQRCFPAGHASGGYALLALYYLPKTRRRKRQALAFAITVGSLMGGYKMIIGHHFLSHTLVSLLLCWIVTNIVALLVLPWPEKAKHKDAELLNNNTLLESES
jgi:membrane-associated PAP2 superfamily phosphatase